MKGNQLAVESKAPALPTQENKDEQDIQALSTRAVIAYILSAFLGFTAGRAVNKMIAGTTDPAAPLSATAWIVLAAFYIIGTLLLAHFMLKMSLKTIVFGETKVPGKLPFIDSLLLLIAFVSLIWLSVLFMFNPISQFIVPIGDLYPSARQSTLRDSVFIVLAVGVFLPIQEELLFRGILTRYLQKYGTLFAVLTSASAFALLHGGTKTIYALVAGLLAGTLLIKTGNLLWTIALHVFYNTSYLLADFLPLTDGVLSQIFVAISIVCLLLYALHRHMSFKHFSLQTKIHELGKSFKADKGKYRAYFSSPGMCVCYVMFMIGFSAFVFKK